MTTRPDLVGLVRSRSAALGITLALLLGVAWSVGPAHSRASEGVSGVLAQDRQPIDTPTEASATDGHASLGQLVGRDTTVLIHAGPDGPSYTLLDASGRTIAEGLDATELRARYPDVIVPSDALMLVDEADSDW